MKIEFRIPFRRELASQTLRVESAPEPEGRPPRIARLMALAHKLDGLVRSDAITSYGELARLGRISPARLTQIMVLLHLAPSIQEYLLFLSAGDARFINELRLRKIAREPRWERQRGLFERLLKNGLANGAEQSDQCHDAAIAARKRDHNNDHIDSKTTTKERTRDRSQ